jgi:Ca2+-transporting ATPase
MAKPDIPGGTSPAGLTTAEVAARLRRYGPNEIAVRAQTSWLKVLVRQFTSPLVLMLIAAAAIAGYLGNRIDTVAILLIVVLNGALGFAQEWQAETAMLALRRMLSDSARVLRDGTEQIIDARGLVPGDLVVVEAGDRVPADIGLSAAMRLMVDESVLTGESLSVEKSTGEGQNLIFMGTSVVAGRGEGVVTATGGQSQFGQIADLTAAVGEKTTHLQRNLARLSRQLGLAAIAVALVVVAAGLATGHETVEMLMTGLSLAVAIVPEGLPAVVTITLALGASAMVRQKALVRGLQAVETLGSASVICTDKTGTLTENMMTAAEIRTPEARYAVSGTGYDPAGHIARDGRRVRAADDGDLAALLRAALICTHAALRREGSGWAMIGEPTEGALVTLAYKGWADLPDADAVVSETPFESERKRMSVLAREGATRRLYVKGAPEQVLEVSTHIRRNGETYPLDPAAADAICADYKAMADAGLRVIALADRANVGDDGPGDGEHDLTFLGIVGLIDPPRPEVKGAIRAAKDAGIRIIMITGDSPGTAAAIARDLGLGPDGVVTGPEIDAMDDDALTRAVTGDAIFARTAPGQKLRIVHALQALGETVAMTGDGVNDAPALKRADIGVAMGQRGTDVAKDAADLVLLDDNFATIVAAIREGRRQYDNVRKFVRYLLSSNAGEVVAILANILLGGPLMFLATQILWMNLVTDGVTAVTLGLEKPEPGQMQRPPRHRDGAIVTGRGLLTILAFGAYTGGASLWLFHTLLPQGEMLARTVAFTAMVVFEKFSVFAFRSLSQPCTRIGWFSNPALLATLMAMLGVQAAAVYWLPLQALLQTQPMEWVHWGQIAALALPLVLIPEVYKYLTARQQHLS